MNKSKWITCFVGQCCSETESQSWQYTVVGGIDKAWLQCSSYHKWPRLRSCLSILLLLTVLQESKQVLIGVIQQLRGPNFTQF